MKTIALATCDRFPDLTGDDQLLVEALRELQIAACPFVWNSSDSWHSAEAVIIRSCWDYHFQPAEFLQWIRSVEAAGIPLWNSHRLIKWNIDKVYLKNLEERGAKVIPTIWLDRSCSADLAVILDTHSWKKVVIKPSISATAFRTCVVSRETCVSGQTRLDEILASSGALVQQFVPAIETNGEWSFIFFAGEFSHGVLKRAKEGDFRVQEEFDGYVDNASPSTDLIKQSQRLVDLIEEPSLFARVDGIEIDGELRLMELELIEPFLFLRENQLAAQRFANAIASFLEA